MKKRNPRQIIESSSSDIEHIYIKMPRQELQEITLKGTDSNAEPDDKKLLEILKRGEYKDNLGLSRLPQYTQVHTHPVRYGEKTNGAMPSSADFRVFLNDSLIKTMVIAQQNTKTGEVEGYMILRKKVKAPKEKQQLGRHSIPQYALAEIGRTDRVAEIKKIAQEYHLQYRWIPAKGYLLPKGGWSFRKKGLEKIAITTAIIGVFTGLFLLSSNITGNVIGSLNRTSTNWIGVILFVIGLVGAFAYFKKR